jgi:uncharacterized protein YlzI (FlbEa/FlbD family)
MGRGGNGWGAAALGLSILAACNEPSSAGGPGSDSGSESGGDESGGGDSGGDETGGDAPDDPDANVPPTAVDQWVEVEAGQSVEVELRAMDPDSTALTFAVVTPPQHGSLAGEPPAVTYTPDLGFSGADRFEFTASDAMATSEAGTVRIAVDVSRSDVVERVAAGGDVLDTYAGDGAVEQCALAVGAGETCLVYPGVYPEWVTTASAGEDGSEVAFLGFGGATIEGFRLRHPYVRIEGFDIHGYQLGLSPAAITVEPTGSDCAIVGNHFRDGVHLNSDDLWFDGDALTITNPDGGFVDAGFAPGSRVYLASNINELILNHDQIKRVETVTDTTLTLAADQTLLTEGPVHSVIYATIQGKAGVQGINFIRSSSAGVADRCRITGNRFTDLGGHAIVLAGGHHVVENNVIEHMNGWRTFDVIGHDNVFRYNQVLSSPRYAGLEPPGPDGPDQTTGEYWDFVTTVILSIGEPNIEVRDNLFEYNYFEALDNEFVNVAQFPSYTTDVADNGRFTFRHNVVIALEMHGAFHQPGCVIEHNTFLGSAVGSPAVFMVSNSSSGVADGSIVRNNAFVGCGHPDNPGYYGVTDTEMAEPPDHDFVAGPPELGYPAAPSFAGAEAHGLNGGDPEWVSIDDPLGPDDLPFTDDDGLRPAPGSPLCGAGSQGTDIGAYPCG